MQADVTEGVPTESIAHQIVRNKRGKRKGKQCYQIESEFWGEISELT